MVEYDAVDFERAVRWLATEGFEASPLRSLAIVLARSGEDAGLISALVERARDLHCAGEYALVVALNPAAVASNMPLPIQNPAVQRWWDEMMCLTKRPGPPPSGAQVLEGVLELLGVPSRVAPCVYVRIRGELPVIVPVAETDAEAVGELLIDLVAESRPTRRTPLAFDALLGRHGLGALAVEDATQLALDAALSADGHRDDPFGRWRSPGEDARRARPSAAVSTEVGRRVALMGRATGNAPSLREEIRAIAPWLVQEDHLRALQTANFAHETGDWGTVCRNLGVVIEGSIVGTLLQAVRGLHKVRLPQYLDLVDPDPALRKLIVAQAELNAPQHRLVGAMSDHQRVPLKAPMLKLSLDATWASADLLPFHVSQAARETLTRLATGLASLRNPASHSAPMTREHANEAWALLREWGALGCARGLADLRRTLEASWPKIGVDVLAPLDPLWQRAQSEDLAAARESVRYAEERLRRVTQTRHLEEDLGRAIEYRSALACLLERAGARLPVAMTWTLPARRTPSSVAHLRQRHSSS